MNVQQLDLFFSPQECEMADLRKNHNLLKNTLDKIRKGTYAEINALKKVCVEISARQEIIERGISNEQKSI